MKILIDTNVILDILCNRADFVEDSLKVFKFCEANQITGCISALYVPNIVYIMRKELDNERIKEILTTLTSLFTVVDLRESDLIKAADLDFSDYGDVLQSVCAARAKANYIVTRNIKDFKNSTVPAIKPSPSCLKGSEPDRRAIGGHFFIYKRVKITPVFARAAGQGMARYWLLGFGMPVPFL